MTVPFDLVDSEYAHERAADLGRCVRSDQRVEQARPRHAFTVSLDVESDDDRASSLIAHAFYDAHYWGRPRRGLEGGLAFYRAVRDLGEDDCRTFFRRRLAGTGA